MVIRVIVYNAVVLLASVELIIALVGAHWIVNRLHWVRSSSRFSSESGASMPTGQVLSRNQAACVILTLDKVWKPSFIFRMGERTMRFIGNLYLSLPPEESPSQIFSRLWCQRSWLWMASGWLRTNSSFCLDDDSEGGSVAGLTRGPRVGVNQRHLRAS